MLPAGITDSARLYERVAGRIEGLISGGALRPGERIPSVRKLSAQLAVSVSTVLEAYRRLEGKHLIEARPQSGYYVRCRPSAPAEPLRTASARRATDLDIGELVMRVVHEASRPDLVRLGAAIPSPEFFPVRQLNRILGQVVRSHPEASQTYASVPGQEQLRVQVARRLLDAGCTVSPEDILITAGAQEAVYLSLLAVTRPGDTVIVETPTYYALLQALESLHLKVLEIATDPRDGICLVDLEAALASQRIAACVLLPTFGNPLGHSMPEERREALLKLVEAHDVAVIEDDVYGELYFGPRRPRALKAFDRDGRVLLCSSVSKTLAPGYRVGWAVPGRYRDRVERLKLSSSVTTASPTQLAVAQFLATGGFDRLQRKLRRTYRELMERMLGAIAEYFPRGTRVTRPDGGHMLWVELAPEVDTLMLHEVALAAGLSIVPGPLFSPSGRYRNFIRLTCAVPWTAQLEHALQTLGRLSGELAAAGRNRRPGR